MPERQAILEGIIEPGDGNLAPALARYVLSLGFSQKQVARYERLAYRAQEGKLTAKQQAELDAFIATETFLIVLKAKARRSLSRRTPAA